MNEVSLENFESRLQETASRFKYPTTPDIASAVIARTTQPIAAGRRWNLRPAVIGMVIFLALVTALLSVPSVRAAVIEFFQIGVIRIWTNPATPTPALTNTPDLRPASGFTATPAATPFDVVSLLDLQGQITLEEAQKLSRYPLMLPSYPEDLGEPDRVFMQGLGASVFIFVWTDPNSPEHVRLSLFQIAPGSWMGEKVVPHKLESTTVNGREALWAEGPYPLLLKSQGTEIRRIVPGSALIWEQDGITYRLEGASSLDEAIKIAESLEAKP